jgi:DNA-binding phage protein
MSELCKKIGISRTHLYHLKAGKQEPTFKILAKLEAAELAAGICSSRQVGDLKIESSAESEGKAKESVGGSGEKKTVEERLEALEVAMAGLREAMENKDRQIDRLLGVLEALARREGQGKS